MSISVKLANNKTSANKSKVNFTEESNITLATVKSFIKNNKGNLFLNIKGRFDGMTDGIEDKHAGFQKAVATPASENYNLEYTQGISGVWFTQTRQSNRFRFYQDETFIGILVINCCGRFIVAVKK